MVSVAPSTPGSKEDAGAPSSPIKMSLRKKRSPNKDSTPGTNTPKSRTRSKTTAPKSVRGGRSRTQSPRQIQSPVKAPTPVAQAPKSPSKKTPSPKKRQKKNNGAGKEPNGPQSVAVTPTVETSLIESFETRVNGVLPALWRSPDEAHDKLKEAHAPVLHDSFTQLPKLDTKTVEDDESFMTDSRGSTPPNSQEADDESYRFTIEDGSKGLSSPPSSPIRKQDPAFLQPQLPKAKSLLTDFGDDNSRSSKKSVGFSDDIECFTSPPPSSSPVKLNVRPLKSILKANELPSSSGAVIPDAEAPNFDAGWVSGCVIQIPACSDDNIPFVRRCIKDLADPEFPNKFEVYASLNYVFRENTPDNVLRYFAAEASKLLDYIFRDVSSIDEYENPFFSRMAIQAFKLASFHFSNPGILQSASKDSIREHIIFCCKLIQSQISKGVASVLLQLLRDQKLSKDIVTLKVAEYILAAALNMNIFGSVSLGIERMNLLKILIGEWSQMMVKNLNSWLPFMFINLTDTGSKSQRRIVKATAQLLSQLCESSLGNKALNFALHEILDQRITVVFNNARFSQQLDEESVSSDPRLCEYLCAKLLETAPSKNSEVALGIWYHLTLLLARPSSNIVYWEFLPQWLDVFKCYSQLPDESSKIHAARAWGAVAYSVILGIDGTTSFRKDKEMLKLLIYPFTLQGVNYRDLSQPVQAEISASFCKVACGLMNAALFHFKNVVTPFDQIWTHFFVPVLDQMHATEDQNDEYMSEMNAVALLILTSLLDNSNPSADKPLDPNKFYISETVQPKDIPKLPAKWIFHQHMAFRKYLIRYLKNKKAKFSVRVDLLKHYISGLRAVTTRELKQNGRLADISSGIPLFVATLFKGGDFRDEYDIIYSLIIQLNDVLGVSALIDDSTDAKNSCFTIMASLSKAKANSETLVEFCKFIANTLGYRLQLPFYQDLFEIDDICLRQFVLQRINERKFTKLSMGDYSYLAMIFQLSLPGEISETVVIGLMNYLLNPILEKHPAKAIESLKIEQWNDGLFILAIDQIVSLRPKYSSARGHHMQEIMKFLVSSKLLNKHGEDSLQFIEAFCHSSRKVELLKYAPILNKSLQLIYDNNASNISLVALVRDCATKILSFYKFDEFGLDSFKELKQLLAESENYESQSSHSSTDTAVVEQEAEKITSIELIMHDDDEDSVQEEDYEEKENLDPQSPQSLSQEKLQQFSPVTDEVISTLQVIEVSEPQLAATQVIPEEKLVPENITEPLGLEFAQDANSKDVPVVEQIPIAKEVPVVKRKAADDDEAAMKRQKIDMSVEKDQTFMEKIHELTRFSSSEELEGLNDDDKRHAQDELLKLMMKIRGL